MYFPPRALLRLPEPLFCLSGLFRFRCWGSLRYRSCPMCDYSLQSVTSRPAKVGDRLTTRNFGTGTRGFAASEDARVAVCVLPGTELAFTGPVERGPAAGLFGWVRKAENYRT